MSTTPSQSPSRIVALAQSRGSTATTHAGAWRYLRSHIPGVALPLPSEARQSSWRSWHDTERQDLHAIARAVIYGASTVTVPKHLWSIVRGVNRDVGNALGWRAERITYRAAIYAARCRRRLDARYTARAERIREALGLWARDDAEGLAEEMRRAHDRRIHAELIDEIEQRGGETTITDSYDRDAGLEITDREEARRLYLFHVDHWRGYSKRFGARRASISYLAGWDGAQRFATRVPGTITTIRAAIGYLTPPEVRAAEEAGRTVLRQGDVYIVECGDRRDRAATTARVLPRSHVWLDGDVRVLVHEQHGTAWIPFPARFARQRALRMGRLPVRRRTGWGD
jgi:hypothetical protein